MLEKPRSRRSTGRRAWPVRGAGNPPPDTQRPVLFANGEAARRSGNGRPGRNHRRGRRHTDTQAGQTAGTSSYCSPRKGGSTPQISRFPPTIRQACSGWSHRRCSSRRTLEAAKKIVSGSAIFALPPIPPACRGPRLRHAARVGVSDVLLGSRAKRGRSRVRIVRRKSRRCPAPRACRPETVA